MNSGGFYIRKKKGHVLQYEKYQQKREEIMFKKMLTILLAVTAISLIGLGSINVAKAQVGVYIGDHACGDLSFDLKSVTPNADGGYDFSYELAPGSLQALKKLSYFSLGIDGNFVLEMSVNGTVESIPFEPGAGNSDGWLEGVPQLQTITSTPQTIAEATPLVISVSGEAGVREGLIAAYIKAGTNVSKCFIYGPVPPPPCPDLPIDITLPKTKQIALNDNLGNSMDYCIEIDPRTGCPANDIVYRCDLGPDGESEEGDPWLSPLTWDVSFVLGSTDPDADPVGPTGLTMIMGEGMDPRCPIAKAAHNPCQWVILSGRPYGPICWQ